VKTQIAFCGQCGAELDEKPTLPVEARAPCPTCGSKIRKFAVSLEGSITPRGRLGYKARHGTGKKPYTEGVTGGSWSYRLLRWLQLKRTVDREADLYEEEVVDPETGEVIHHQKEPLSRHTGHGSAKKPRL
jgi:hypothetical protein